MARSALEDAGDPGAVPWPERAATALATAGIAALCVIVTVSVASRWWHRSIIPDDVLIVQELMVVVILFPLVEVTGRNSHIAVTVLSDRLGKAVQPWLDRLGHLAGLVLAGFLLAAGWKLLSASLATGDYYDGLIDMPMWIGHLSFVIGVGGFFLRLLLLTVRGRPERAGDPGS